ncbi:hypothetical protein FNF31_00356 [Cafeteria roenbergensis]|uniref:AMMECR1 domain-containing protein n=1 Tax=Cafeteria roenbergensis TaxID=33653 RepID=A0A5A8DUY5_CAFRO|nr:hypothetical protein FNF31_00356 [Cafeteria roenbergensis]
MAFATDLALRLCSPYFVTFNTKARDGSWVLRGCIGCLSPRPLSQLGEYANLAAFGDRRFDPIAEHELPGLQCCVSLLVDYEGPLAWNDFEIKKHGIIIDFESGGRKFSATYLPEVAHEQGWDHRETVASLVRKSGYRGAVDEALLGGITLTRYQSSKAKATHAEFQAAMGAR